MSIVTATTTATTTAPNFGWDWSNGAYSSYGEYENVAAAASLTYGEEAFNRDPWHAINRFLNEEVDCNYFRYQIRPHREAADVIWLKRLGENPLDYGYHSHSPGMDC